MADTNLVQKMGLDLITEDFKSIFLSVDAIRVSLTDENGLAAEYEKLKKELTCNKALFGGDSFDDVMKTLKLSGRVKRLRVYQTFCSSTLPMKFPGKPVDIDDFCYVLQLHLDKFKEQLHSIRDAMTSKRDRGSTSAQSTGLLRDALESLADSVANFLSGDEGAETMAQITGSALKKCFAETVDLSPCFRITGRSGIDDWLKETQPFLADQLGKLKGMRPEEQCAAACLASLKSAAASASASGALEHTALLTGFCKGLGLADIDSFGTLTEFTGALPDRVLDFNPDSIDSAFKSLKGTAVTEFVGRASTGVIDNTSVFPGLLASWDLTDSVSNAILAQARSAVLWSLDNRLSDSSLKNISLRSAFDLLFELDQHFGQLMTDVLDHLTSFCAAINEALNSLSTCLKDIESKDSVLSSRLAKELLPDCFKCIRTSLDATKDSEPYTSSLKDSPAFDALNKIVNKYNIKGSDTGA